ncbi:MAG: phage holin family protein, partial [Opitutaceae bacterium]|nr:phage holin family protein [Opitutaceae bacterium]
MENRPPVSSGFLKNLTSLGDSLIGALQERIELVSVELQEEKYRFVRLIIWISAAVFAGGMTLSFATLTIVYLLWDTARLAALGGFTLLYGGVLAWVIVMMRRQFTHQPKP